MEKKKYFICPLCNVKHNLKKMKTSDMMMVMIRCNCGADSMIQVKNGYHVPSKNGIKKIL
ncbi:hypothetical protein [Romboutsia sp.]|uniref:hypothetical protein n=1 Tax=Romboutsia sp. TaxID=1965302 RepID=UPI003F3967C4